MAYSYTWPATLPQNPRFDFQEVVGAVILRTPMDKGPAKMRLRGNMPDTLSLGFIMTTAQVATLRTFVDTTISRTARFGFPHPRTGATVEARLVPSDNGSLFTVVYLAQGLFNVDLTLEVMP